MTRPACLPLHRHIDILDSAAPLRSIPDPLQPPIPVLNARHKAADTGLVEVAIFELGMKRCQRRAPTCESLQLIQLRCHSYCLALWIEVIQRVVREFPRRTSSTEDCAATTICPRLIANGALSPWLQKSSRGRMEAKAQNALTE